MTIFKRHKIKKQIKSLHDKSEYAMTKMMEHQNDEDAIVWKRWALLNALYLGEMVKLKAQLNGIEV